MADLTDTLSIENVVASTSIDQEVDLAQLAIDFTASQYDPAHFPGLIYRLDDPAATAMMFRSGALICTGATSKAAATTAIERTLDELRALGIGVPDEPEITIQNIVTVGDLGQELNLHALTIGFGLEHVEYEPEQFPGLVYRLDEPEVVVLLFGSGKIVITGATQPADAERAIDRVHDDIEALGLL
jgi:transcription initiation factor TFIID TATA-box-binding protein